MNDLSASPPQQVARTLSLPAPNEIHKIACTRIVPSRVHYLLRMGVVVWRPSSRPFCGVQTWQSATKLVPNAAAHPQTSNASPANLMAQLEEINSLAGRVQTQTEAHKADRWVDARPGWPLSACTRTV
jgi:hypothetical protein